MPIPFSDDEVRQLNDQWNLWQFEVRVGNERAFPRALKWVLINSFGTDREYQFDPEFHARVEAAWQMINRLVETRDEARADWNDRA